MRLYRVKAAGHDGVGPTVTRYVGTQADCPEAKRQVSEITGVGVRSLTAEEVEVPTDKKGLLAFINKLVA